MKLKHLIFILVLSLSTAIITGCSNTNEEKEEKEKSVVQKPAIVKESSIIVEKEEKLITQKGFLHGFPDDNLVEFKVEKENTETLRIFNMENEIASYLEDEKQDGKSEFLLTYMESEDGINPPVLVEIEKK